VKRWRSVGAVNGDDLTDKIFLNALLKAAYASEDLASFFI